MKIVSMTCPNCGAILQVDADNKNVTCNYCGNALFIDDEMNHVKIDNPEQVGYDFEKGRQSAQSEQRYTQPNTYAAPNIFATPKKRKTWLWVLGWLFIFPLPLTIILVRKKNMNTILKYGIIAIAWVVYLGIGLSGRGGSVDHNTIPNNENGTVLSLESKETENTNPVEFTINEKEPTESMTDEINGIVRQEPESETKKEILYAEDLVVNRFITAFNENTQSPLSDIKKGNIRTKYYAHSYEYSCTLLHAVDTDKIHVTINENNDTAENGVNGMKELFRDVVSTIDPNLSNEEIYSYFDQMSQGHYAQIGERLGNTVVEYSPDMDSFRGWIKVYEP